jgi:prevent-host-death family protein
MPNIISISQARANLPSLIKKLNQGIDRFLITVNNKPKAVILSLDELESLEETAEVFSIPRARESIMEGLREAKEGKVIPFEPLKT